MSATATRALSGTATMTATPPLTSATMTPRAGPTASIQLPYAARNAVPAAGRPSIVWAQAQFTFEDDLRRQRARHRPRAAAAEGCRRPEHPHACALEGRRARAAGPARVRLVDARIG
ncbi:MAG: hypothetical protein U0470_01825 [Anaerolineae bacterium]